MLKKSVFIVFVTIFLMACNDDKSGDGRDVIFFLGGSGDDSVIDITTGPGGDFFVTGKSSSAWGSPVRAYSSNDDVFVAKVTSSGKIIWLSFLGGSGNDTPSGICLDSSGYIYVAGTSNATWGEPKRAYISDNDCFIAKLDSSGNLLWNTFLGGSGNDTSSGICLDSSGYIYIAGTSNASWGAPNRPYTSKYDMYTAKVRLSDVVIAWSAFYGGNGDDYAKGIAAYSNSLYVCGYSNATWGLPVRDFSSSNDAVVFKLAQTDSALEGNTFLGGTGYDYGLGISVDTTGNIFVTGYSTVTWGAPLRAYTDGDDAFAVRINTSLDILWNTFLGGQGDDTGCAVHYAGTGHIYIAGTSGESWGGSSYTVNGGLDVNITGLSYAGEIESISFFGSSETDVATAVKPGTDNRVFFSGYSYSSWGNPLLAYSSGQDGFIAELKL